jgi:glycosyltransferase involved in cell wall biosynthesis
MLIVSVVIPSLLKRNRSNNKLFLEQAVASIRAQTACHHVILEIIVGVDLGSQIPASLQETLGVKFIESRTRSGSAAYNAATRQATGDYIAFLEDDDQWDPAFLDIALKALKQSDFVSSTQLEVTDDGDIVRINDFATPSGWVMKANTWRTIGIFNEQYIRHHDNEWLGRLAEKKFKRIHLIEATAPLTFEASAQVRPWLANVLRLGGPSVRLARHESPWPMIRRLVHSDSGMQQIARDLSFRLESEREYAMLRTTFGCIPW